MHKILAALALLSVIGWSGTANAKIWAIDYPNSHLFFVAKQSDGSFTGEFRKFDAAVDFDPADPEKGSIKANIDIISATAGSADRDAYLPQTEWFDTRVFPKASFESTVIKAGVTPGCFQAFGTLIIKNISKQVILPFCLTTEGDHAHVQGKLMLQRNDYNVGTGQWASEDTVAHAVTVEVDLVAR